MAEKQYFVTQEGLAALEKELDYLKTVRRREVAEKIKVALSFGDLSENSEYDEAKNDQAMVEARIADVEVMLKGAVVIDESRLNNETVHIGSKVEVSVVSPTGVASERAFRIVGSNEADPRGGKISDESAVGKALIGAKVGQAVEVDTPAGLARYTVVTISR
ncbi:transcription elongation factor GreA [Acutalibacter caecimuris]|uniref:transcription elongation factor GreA n=1 Tax=Acutalibacter caecimuris TaxID=3093657 RepID=UPI002AC8D2E6|nr:transcription elongation factor GreA [Acutalibacter sp. M00118]